MFESPFKDVVVGLEGNQNQVASLLQICNQMNFQQPGDVKAWICKQPHNMHEYCQVKFFYSEDIKFAKIAQS